MADLGNRFCEFGNIFRVIGNIDEFGGRHALASIDYFWNQVHYITLSSYPSILGIIYSLTLHEGAKWPGKPLSALQSL